MFPDPFLPRVAVTVGKGSGYARLGMGRLQRMCFGLTGVHVRNHILRLCPKNYWGGGAQPSLEPLPHATDLKGQTRCT